MDNCIFCMKRYICNGMHQFNCEMSKYSYYEPDAEAIERAKKGAEEVERKIKEEKEMEKRAMEKRMIAVYVTEEYAKKCDNITSYIFDYEKSNVKLRTVGSKEMFFVSNNEGESELLIDADAVVAIDYNMIVIV